MPAPAAAPEIPSRLLEEAADWLVRLQSGDDDPAMNAEFERWRRCSPAHAAAWQRAEAVLQEFRRVPAGIGRQTLGKLRDEGRRRALRALGIIAVAAPAGWLLWRQQAWLAWQADFRTATGEQKTLHLADGTRLTLNTASAVAVVFDGQARQLRLLKGEIMLTTAADPRPFLVQTAEGTLQPLGTQFSVRQQAESTQLAVFDGRVRIATRGGREHVLEAGQQSVFDALAIGEPRPLAASDALWTEGMLVARNMRLADWAAEVSRYRPGLLRCHPALAELRVSGAFPLTDTDASLDLLLRTRPLSMRRLTRYWVSLEPRG